MNNDGITRIVRSKVLRLIGISISSLREQRNMPATVLMVRISRTNNSRPDSIPSIKEPAFVFSAAELEILSRNITHLQAVSFRCRSIYWNHCHIQNPRNYLSWQLKNNNIHQFPETRQDNQRSPRRIDATAGINGINISFTRRCFLGGYGCSFYFINASVAERGFLLPDRLFNQMVTAQCSRHLCVVRTRPAYALLSKYTQPSIVSHCPLVVPVSIAIVGSRSKGDGQVAKTVKGKQM